ncbi:helix-turn-helix domain-containing protein [Staphylococcus sp. 11-B-312]|uniref:helix-turn-helix domain-containing protein n=1 Tax=Staphylococcus sp. 11-B-312 TaxID=2799680 RepID=UPI001939C93F|nr:helix-turn-helix domain-containing protein [Staphylococcus sp. 11-B-312]QQV52257.1 helix-turn-helix domain-containing protein [Staphylococcus sp. 11-B-312]
MGIIRIDKTAGNYFIASKYYVEDENISWKAKGIMSYLFSKPDDWQIYQTQLEKVSKDGKASVRSTINELINNGYMTRQSRRKTNGDFDGYDYTLHEYPINNGVRKMEDAKMEIAKMEIAKSDTTNNNSTNNDLTNNDINTSATKVTQEQFDQWWNLYDKKLDKKKAFSLFKSALKKYEFETIMNGTKNYLKTITDKQYQKYPKTFLSQESFLNDYGNEVKTSEESYLDKLMEEG